MDRAGGRALGMAVGVIAGLCMSLAQAIPQAGEKLTTDNGTVLEVIEASPRRVRRVRIHPVAQSDDATAEAPQD